MKRKLFGIVMFLITTIYALGAININKTASITEYIPGESFAYTIRVENTDSVAKSGLTVTDDMSGLPLTEKSVTVDEGPGSTSNTYSFNNKVFNASNVTIGANSYVEYKLEVKLDSGASGDIANISKINDGATTLGTDSVTIKELDQAAAITLDKTSPTSEYDNGRNIIYKVKVTNSSDKKIENIKILDDLSSLRFSKVYIDNIDTSGTGTDPKLSKGELSSKKIDIPDAVIGPKGHITYRIRGVVDATQSMDIVNTAKITVVGKETIKSVTHTRTIYDYTVTKSVVESNYTPGQPLTYKVKLKNNKNNRVMGLDIHDLLSNIKATDIDGNSVSAFDMTNTTVNGSASTGSNTGLASNPLSGDLVATSAEIAPNGWIEYTITTTVNNKIIGNIINTAKIIETTRNNHEESSNTVTITQGKANITLDKIVTPTVDYKPGDYLTYTITVGNTGSGYGEKYIVNDLLSAVKTQLSSDYEKKFDSSDTTDGNPFISTDTEIKLLSKGNNSVSKNYTTTGVKQPDLMDEIFVAPNETIVYEVKVKINQVAIGDIKNEVEVDSPTSVTGFPKKADVTTTPLAFSPANAIEIEKIIDPSTQSEYQPGDKITYLITVKNTDSNHYINNFKLEDKISEIKTDILDIDINSGSYGGKTVGEAFESWTLETTDPITNHNFTKSGTGNSNSDGNSISGNGTDDIKLDVDLAPGKTVTYKLVATIKKTAVGKIVDHSTNDNVVEKGEGVIMSSPKLGLVKTVNKTNYSPNEMIEYKLVIENNGHGYAENVEIKDLLSKIIAGTNPNDKAYSEWEITSKLEKLNSLGVPESGHSGIKSEPLITDLDVKAQIGPNTKLTYVIEAKIDCKATGKIRNEGKVNGKLVADKGIVSNPANLTVTKTVDIDRYASTDGHDELTYTIVVSNPNGGFIKDVHIVDDFKDIEVELLNSKKVKDIFESYTIETKDSGGCSNLNPPPSGPQNFNGKLDKTISISGNQTIQYIIKAKLKKDYPNDIIPWGQIKNKGTVTANGQTINMEAETNHKNPNLAIVKSTTDTQFTPGSIVHYKIRVDNNGAGYANNARITDAFNSAQFEYWEVTSTNTDGNKGSGNYKGSDPVVSGILPGSHSKDDINVRADITPGGFVEYNIEALVKSTVPSTDTITNTANVHDKQSGNDYSSSVDLNGTNKGLYITKTADKFNYIPGQPLKYTITIFNTTTSDIDFKALHYEVSDKFSDIKINLANDGTNPPTDVTNGNPFDSISWKGDDGTTGTGDINDQPVIPARKSNGDPGSYKYTVTTQVSNRVLHGKMKNEVFLVDANNKKFAKASVELNGGGNRGNYWIDVDKNQYKPGDDLTYTITIRGGNDGYANNIKLNEEISKIQVKLMDGTTAPVFGDINNTPPKFTWTLTNPQPDPGTSKPTKPADNTDLTGAILDVAPGNVITYTVTGKIRPDADGDIKYKDSYNNRTLVTSPHRHNLDIKKYTDKSSYIPGDDITFIIDIENNSSGNAGQISLLDEISKLKVNLSDGTIGDAFISGWTITPEKTGKYIDYVDFGTVSPNNDINTKFNLPVGTRIKYKITGKVNPKAIGKITNSAFIDGDQVGAEIGTSRPGLQGSKEIVDSYDLDGTTSFNRKKKYKPGGFIEYKLIVKNVGNGIMDNVEVTDLLSDVKTRRIDGTTTLPAYSSWVITNEPVTSPTFIPTYISTDDLKNLEIDIAPKSEVVFHIKAKVDERAIGSIENIASSGSFKVKSGKSTAFSQHITITKKAFEKNGTTSKLTYKPGDEFQYKIRIKNTGRGISRGKTPSFKDLLEDIIVEVPGDPHKSENPFTTWSVTATKGNTDLRQPDTVTSLGDFVSPNKDKNIEHKGIYIAPNGWIEYVIDAKIRDDAMTTITNKGTYYPNGKRTYSDTAVLQPLAPDMDVEKRIVSIGGQTWTSKMKYKPGDEVIYEIKAKNIGESFGRDILVEDLISSMKAEISGGTSEVVFDSWNIDDDGGTNKLTFIHPYTKSNADLKAKMDIAPGDTVTFTVTAKVRDNLIGTIPSNKVVVKDGVTELKSAATDDITPNDPKLSYSKEISIDGTTYGSTDVDYIPSNSLYYKVTLKNTGLGFGVKVNVKDILKDVKDGKGKPAFSSATTIVKITDKHGVTHTGTNDGKTVVSNFVNNLNGFDTSIDIEPGATVEFLVDAKVKNTALGDIKNKATIDGTDTNEVVAHLAKSTIDSTKKATQSHYSPGHPIEYILTVENTGKSTAQDITLKEVISNIEVKALDGTMKKAFKTGWTIASTKTDSDGNSDISNIPTSGDINTTITLGAGDKVEIKINATVIDDAIGDIDNTFTTDYNRIITNKLAKILHSNSKLHLSKNPVNSITGTTVDTIYTPNNEKTFLVEVTNTGAGFALGVDILDEFMKINTLGGGNFNGSTNHEVLAFTGTPTVTWKSKNNNSLTKPIGNPVIGEGFKGKVNIAPGDTFQIRLTANLHPEAMKDIDSKVEVTYDPNKLVKASTSISATATIKSISDSLSYTKEISLDGSTYNNKEVVYSSGDKIYYRITADNTGLGWSDDIDVLDIIKDIKADIAGGGQGPAFDPSTIKITPTYPTPNYSKGDLNTGTGINGIFDLPPKQKIEFKVEATINSDVIGNIDNLATFTKKGAKTDTNIVVAKPKGIDLAKLIITKEQSLDGTNYTNADLDYKTGGKAYYKVIVENKNATFVHNLKVEDLIDSIMVDNAGNPSSIKAFKNITVKDIITAPSMFIGTPSNKDKIDATLDLASNHSVEFIVEADVVNTAIGEIKNTATTSYNGTPKSSNEVILNPIPADIVITKITPTSLAIPGQNVEYEITIKNNGGLANDLKFIDDISAIKALLSNTNIDGEAFESVTATVENAVGATPKTPILDTTGNKVTSTFDLAGNGEVKIKIIAKLKNTMVYGVNSSPTDRTLINIAKYEFTKYGATTPTTGESKPISVMVANADMKVEKTAIVDPNLGGYIPGDDVEFRIKVKNDGEGIGDKFHILDELDKIMVDAVGGTQKKAFSSWTITVINGGTKTPITTIPTFDSTKNLDMDIDVAPGDEVEFKIIAKTINDAYGEIKNDVTGSYDQKQHNDGATASDINDSAAFQPSRSEVHIEKSVNNTTFAPGDELEYTIRLWNVGPGPAHKVKFEDVLPKAKTTTSASDTAFDLTTMSVTTTLSNGASENTPVTLSGDTYSSEVEMPRDGEVIYVIKGKVANNVVGKIDNIATFKYTDNDGTDKDDKANAESSPVNAKLSITKTVDKTEFIAGKDLTYTVTISNTGLGIANDVKVTDMILDIQNKSVNGNIINSFDSVVITDNGSSLNPVSSIDPYDPNKNLDTLVDIAPGDTVVFTLVGTTNKMVGEDITNKADYIFTNNNGKLGKGHAEISSKVKLNDGMLQLTKRALKKDVEKGQVVEYEIIVTNPTQTYFTNVAIEDKTPAGFQYIKDTTEMTLSTNGTFGDNDDIDVSDEPLIGNTLGFTAVNIAPKESLRIRYILRASIGTTFGKYVNTAHAVSGRSVVSNYDSASVEVIPDALFDTATIIGKVFEDINGDGYQSDATAKKIKVNSPIKSTDYVPNSTTLTIDGKTTKIKDRSSPLERGITIDKLHGVSRNRKINKTNKAIIRYKSLVSKWEPLKLTTKSGTNITIDKNGKAKVANTGDVAKKLVGENIKITRNVYAQKGTPVYVQEIVIENLGIYEDGIPGVRLITLGGVVITTDEFGRYHVPDEWVTRKTGSNFLVKLDRDSLPQGMKVISENPRVRRITPNGLNKFNFSIQRESDNFDIKGRNKIRRVRGKDND